MSPHVMVEDNKLVIPEAREEDQGTYRCVASNSEHTVFKQVTLYFES